MIALASLAPSAHRGAFPGLAAAISRNQVDDQQALAGAFDRALAETLNKRLLDGLQPLQDKA